MVFANSQDSSPQVLQGSVSETANVPSAHPVWSALGRVVGATASTLADVGQQYLSAHHPIDWSSPPELPQAQPSTPPNASPITPQQLPQMLQPLQPLTSFTTPPLSPLKPVEVPKGWQQTYTRPGRLDMFPPYQPNPQGFNPAAQQHTDTMLSYLPNQPIKAAGLIAQSQHYANYHPDDMGALIHKQALNQMTDSLNAMPAGVYAPPRPRPSAAPQLYNSQFYLSNQPKALKVTSDPNLSSTDVSYTLYGRQSALTSPNNLVAVSLPTKRDKKPTIRTPQIPWQNGNLRSATPSSSYQQHVQKIRQLALRLKELETLHKQDKHQGIDSVDALSHLLEYAAKAYPNQPDMFFNLVNDVLIGSDRSEWQTTRLGIHRSDIPTIQFGDLGMNPLYQDHTDNQITHFWAYVNYGYKFPTDIAKAGNFFHEQIEPIGTHLKGSRRDSRLSAVGINVGKALRAGNLKLTDLPIHIHEILRSSRYNPISNKNLYMWGLDEW